MTKIEIFLVMLVVVFIAFVFGSIALSIVNKFSSSAWFCNHFGWHEDPHEVSFDGLSYTGKCPRCGRYVLIDSDGDWFNV